MSLISNAAPLASSKSLVLQSEEASETLNEKHPGAVGRFQIRSCLGRGAFGAVYRAFDPQMEREVALKIPHTGTLTSHQHISRFLQEGKAVAQLHHPNIVPVYESGQAESDYYIASRFVRSVTLKEANARGLLDLRQKVKIIRALAEALDYAHSCGIIHRDVKPANVLLDKKGQAYLVDFGLAYREDESLNLTREGMLLGTPVYMAPEQAQVSGPSEVSPTCDQYSLGVVLYELLCGRLPFYGPPEIVVSLLAIGEPDPPRKVDPSVPRDLETICMKAMAKDPAQRYIDCQSMADDLRRWLKGEPLHARRVKLLEKGIRWCRRNPLVFLLWSASLVLILVVLSCVATAKISLQSAAEEKQNREAMEQQLLLSQSEKQASWQQTQLALKDLTKRQEAEKECLAHLDEGMKHLKAGEKEKAILAMQKAVAIKGVPPSLLEHVKRCLALAQVESKKKDRLTPRQDAELASYYRHLEEGIQAATRSRWKHALDELQKAMQLESKLRRESVLLESDHRVKKLLMDVLPKAVVQNQEQRVNKLLHDARQALNKKEFMESADLVLEALKLNPAQPKEALALLKTICTVGAGVALKEEKKELALLLLDRYLAWDKQDAEALRWKSNVMKALARANKPPRTAPQVKVVPILVPVVPPPPPGPRPPMPPPRRP